jgi:DNA-directed RNA polymerase subunit M/transcription elongation factor TFIIS
MGDNKMNLPMIDATPSYVITLPVSGKEVKYRPYKVGEEITFLTANNSEDRENILESFSEITKKCVMTENFEFSDLNVVDFSYLLLHIRAKSKGELVEVEKTCSKCEFKEPFSFDILKSILIENKEVKKIVVDVSDNIKIELGTLPYTYIKDSIKFSNNKEQLALYSLASSVKKIVYNGDIYNKFTVEEVLENFISNLTQQQLKLVSEKLSGLPKIKGQIKCVCPNCKHEDTITLDDLFSFLD